MDVSLSASMEELYLNEGVVKDSAVTIGTTDTIRVSTTETVSDCVSNVIGQQSSNPSARNMTKDTEPGGKTRRRNRPRSSKEKRQRARKIQDAISSAAGGLSVKVADRLVIKPDTKAKHVKPAEA